MKKLALVAPLALVSCAAFAGDVIWKQAGAPLGPVVAISCATDAGLLCTRDAGALGSIACNSASATEPGCITPSDQNLGAGTKTFTGTVNISTLDAGQAAIGVLEVTNTLQTIGAATGALPACGSGGAGMLDYDQSLSREKICNGSSWQQILNTGDREFAGMLATGICPGVDACPENTNFQGGSYFSIPSSATGITDAITCSWTAGTGGTTGVVVQVYDVTSSAEVCHCTMAACTASGLNVCACIGALTHNHVFDLRLTSATDCSANPTNVVCTAHFIANY